MLRSWSNVASFKRSTQASSRRMVENKTGAFCTRSCPFSSPSSSFTSKSLQSWTRNVSRNASESGWKRSNRRSRKTPVRPREPRVAAVSGFPGTAGRVPTGSPKTGAAPPCGSIAEATNAEGNRLQAAFGGEKSRKRRSRTKPRGRARPAAVTSARGADSFGLLRGRSKSSEKQSEGVAE